jgi:hypothetical protein
MKHLEGSGTPVIYIGRTVLKEREIFEFSSTNFFRNLWPSITCSNWPRNAEVMAPVEYLEPHAGSCRSKEPVYCLSGKALSKSRVHDRLIRRLHAICAFKEELQLRLRPRLRVSGTLPLLLLYAFTSCTVTPYQCYLSCVRSWCRMGRRLHMIN